MPAVLSLCLSVYIITFHFSSVSLQNHFEDIYTDIKFDVYSAAMHILQLEAVK